MTQSSNSSTAEDAPPNGAAWAALLAAGIGGLAFGILTDISECSTRISKLLVWYRPSGALSGVAISATMLWFIAWAVLHSMWRNKKIAAEKTLLAVISLLAIAAIVATFPPFYELLGG